jgi:hypothetical protein
MNREISVADMKSAYNFTFYPQPSREDKKRILTIDTKGFYQIEDEGFKEKYYEHHLKECHNNPVFSPVYFFIRRDNGKLLIQDHEPYTADDEKLKPVNPFNEADREKLKTALRAGVDFDNEYRRDSYFQILGETMPEMLSLIEKALAAEGRDVAEPDPPVRKNTPENFRKNLIELGKRPGYRDNVMAAAQYLIRTAAPSDRERLKGKLVSLGCADPESTKKILASWIRERSGTPRGMILPEPGAGR